MKRPSLLELNSVHAYLEQMVTVAEGFPDDLECFTAEELKDIRTEHANLLEVLSYQMIQDACEALEILISIEQER